VGQPRPEPNVVWLGFNGIVSTNRLYHRPRSRGLQILWLA